MATCTLLLSFTHHLPLPFSFHTSCLDRYGLIHQARISASVNAMRVLNTGTEVEAAVADALVSCFGIFAFRRDILYVIKFVVVERGLLSKQALRKVFMQTFCIELVGLE